MKNDVIDLFREQDSYAAIALLAGQPDPLAAARVYVEVMRELYWQQKDLRGVVAIARAGIQHGITAAAALESRDPDAAYQLRSIAKGLAYDLGSFTWPGWNEPGIAIDPSQQAIGLDAARANRRWARELGKGDLPTSRASWLVGAHLLAAGEGAAAREQFLEGARFAQAAGSRADELLCRGFACLTVLLSAAEDAAAAREMESIRAELGGIENGPGFAQQIETAQRVFSGASPAALAPAVIDSTRPADQPAAAPR